MSKRKKRSAKNSPGAIVMTLHEMSCQLAGVPDGSRAPTDEQIRTTIRDLTAQRSGMSREALDAMSKEERLRVVEAHMPRDAEELSRLLAEEWTRRAKEAACQVMQGLARMELGNGRRNE
jgi:hypothetical protein